MIVTHTPSNPILVIGDYTNKSMSRIKTIMCLHLGHGQGFVHQSIMQNCNII